MSHGIVIGGVTQEGRTAYTVATAEAPSMRRVLFSIAVRDSQKIVSHWNCVADNPDHKVLDEIEAGARPGRGVRLEYELCARPFEKRGVKVAESRFLRVVDVKFLDRHATVPADAEAVG